MSKTTTTNTPKEAPQGCYKVSADTAAIIDCIRAANELYGKILDVMYLLYDAKEVAQDLAAEHADKYLTAINGINDMLYNEVKERIADGISTASADEESIII